MTEEITNVAAPKNLTHKSFDRSPRLAPTERISTAQLRRENLMRMRTGLTFPVEVEAPISHLGDEELCTAMTMRNVRRFNVDPVYRAEVELSQPLDLSANSPVVDSLDSVEMFAVLRAMAVLH